jgi:hypothetical protein
MPENPAPPDADDSMSPAGGPGAPADSAEPAEPAQPAQPAEPATPPELPSLPGRFLIGAGTVGLLLAVCTLLLVYNVAKGNLDWTLPQIVAMPLVVMGVVLCCWGAALAATDWRAQYKPTASAEARDASSVGAIIDALGKLKGAALILVSGLVLLLGTAWIAASDAGSDGDTPDPGSTASPTATAS